MNSTNVYWKPPNQFFKQTFLKPVTNTLGFWIPIPNPEPVSTGHYYGEGRENVFGLRELSFDTRPEMHAINNVMDARFKNQAEFMKIDRSKRTIRI